MPDWNPSSEVLGPEWWPMVSFRRRVYSGAPADMQRLPSTATETVDALRMSVTVDPEVRDDIRTIVDIVEEGSEVLPPFERAYLSPNSDAATGGWEDEGGATTNLFQSIDDPTTRWPAPGTTIEDEEIRTFTNDDTYECTLDASLFEVAGDLENARIGFVSVQAIYSSTGAHRKLRTFLRHIPSDTLYAPAGGNLRVVHAFGAIYDLWFGELNPQTELPWTPADLASFDTGGDWVIQVRSKETGVSTTRFPRVHALSLEVVHSPTENRQAVAVWRRPEDGTLTSRLENITTDALVSMPSGTAGWSKATGENHLYIWRQSVTPALFGPSIADDVRWNGSLQRLASDGEPPGAVFPLTAVSDRENPPDDALASDRSAYDFVGRLLHEDGFGGRFDRKANAIVPMVSGVPSVDGQPYRIDLSDLVIFSADSGPVAQRVTPDASEDWLGFRFPVVPPFADSSITVSVHTLAGAQVGGDATFSAADIGNGTERTAEGFHYVTGFLSAGASLTASTTYDVRVSASGPDTAAKWFMPGPDISLAPEIGFGGGTDGLVQDTTHDGNRNLTICLLKQPDPPTAVTAAITDVAITTQVQGVTTVEHVALSWTAPAVSMGGDFRVYEVERRLDGGQWRRMATVDSEGTTSLPDDDHEAPRDTLIEYRVRAVGADGRISQWAESNGVTPTAPGSLLILTSNHDPSLEVVYLFDRESSYPVLSNEEDEFRSLYGVDRQVVFMPSEDRGEGWSTDVTLNQLASPGKGGINVLRSILDLVRSLDIPYVCVMDHQGTQIFGHVEVAEPRQSQPGHIYKTQITVTPTDDVPVPVLVID